MDAKSASRQNHAPIIGILSLQKMLNVIEQKKNNLNLWDGGYSYYGSVRLRMQHPWKSVFEAFWMKDKF
jgi:hypothetical protein